MPQAGNHVRAILTSLAFPASVVADILAPLKDVDEALHDKLASSIAAAAAAATTTTTAAAAEAPKADGPVATAIRAGQAVDAVLERIAQGESTAGAVKAVLELAVKDASALDAFKPVLLRVLHEGVPVQIAALDDLAALSACVVASSTRYNTNVHARVRVCVATCTMPRWRRCFARCMIWTWCWSPRSRRGEAGQATRACSRRCRACLSSCARRRRTSCEDGTVIKVIARRFASSQAP